MQYFHSITTLILHTLKKNHSPIWKLYLTFFFTCFVFASQISSGGEGGASCGDQGDQRISVRSAIGEHGKGPFGRRG